MRVHNPFKNLKLDAEEQEIERQIKAGQWKPVKNVARQMRRYQRYAAFTLDKTRNINIRVSQVTLSSLKSRVIAEGLPYQTLVSSILHKYVHGTL